MTAETRSFAGAEPAMSMAGVGTLTSEEPIPGSPPQGLLARIRGMLFAPKLEWPVIAREPTTALNILQQYVLPLALFSAVVSFVRVSLIGVSLPFAGTIRTPIVGGLLNAALTCLMGIVGVCIVAAIINALAPRFGGVREWRQALKASAYSLTPGFVGSLFGLLPAMGTLLGILAGIYGIYVLYLGLPTVMRSTRERGGAYTAWVVICTIILGFVLGAVSAAIGIGSGAMLASMRPAISQEARREAGAATVANVIGNALGTDERGKAGLTSALSNLAKAGEQMKESQSSANAADTATSATPPATERSASPSSSNNHSAAGDPAQNPLGAAGGLLSALGGALAGSHPKQPVDFHKLQQALPESVAGLPRTHVEAGARQAIGVKGASAKATYGGMGNSPEIEIEISDMTGVAGLMDLAGSLPITETSESDTGYEKDVTVSGRAAHEKFDRGSRHGEVSTIVAKRFSVDVTGNGLAMEDLEKALAQVNLPSLETMKDAGGTP